MLCLISLCFDFCMQYHGQKIPWRILKFAEVMFGWHLSGLSHLKLDKLLVWVDFGLPRRILKYMKLRFKMHCN